MIKNEFSYFYVTAKYVFDIQGFGLILRGMKQYISLSSPLSLLNIPF